MANLVNIWAESNANMIGDDSSPTLTIENSSTGSPLQVVSHGATSLINALTSGASTTLMKVSSTVGFGYVTGISLASMRWGLKVDINGVENYIPVYGKASLPV